MGYRCSDDGSVSISGKQYAAGEAIPEAVMESLSEKDLARLKKLGVIEPLMVSTEEGEVEADVEPSPEPDISPWVLDPDLLDDKSVEQLQVMIRERWNEDPKKLNEALAALDTADLARDFLSQDFKKAD